MRRARAVQHGAGLAITMAVVGCATIIGATDDYESIAISFCKCEDLSTAWPGEDCVSHIDGRLSSATENVRAAWIDAFEKNACDLCDNTAGRAQCKSSEPICAATGGSCGSTDVCCKVPGKTVYCSAANVCVAETDNCTPPFQPCDDATPICCGQTGFQGGCVEQTAGDYICLETCAPDDAANCAGCCGFFSSSAGSDLQSQNYCVAGDACAFVCDPVHDPCVAPAVCHPAIGREGDTYFGVDACLQECDPDTKDTCAKGSCCVRFHDEGANEDVGRCLDDTQACLQRCDVKNALGTPANCTTNRVCEAVKLAPSPTGTFSIFQCVAP